MTEQNAAAPQRDVFLGILSHEMRTPLGAIIGYHELLAEGIFGELDPRVSDGIDRMRSAADQLLALAAGISDAALDDPSLMLTDIRQCSIDEVFEQALAALASEATGRSTQVIVDEQPQAVTILTDPDRLQRAIILVLHAAIKKTPGGVLRLRASLSEADSADGFELVLTGGRIDPDDVPLASPLLSRSACALRLSIASHTLRPVGGGVTVMHEGSDAVVTLRVPAPRPAETSD